MCSRSTQRFRSVAEVTVLLPSRSSKSSASTFIVIQRMSGRKRFLLFFQFWRVWWPLNIFVSHGLMSCGDNWKTLFVCVFVKSQQQRAWIRSSGMRNCSGWVFFYTVNVSFTLYNNYNRIISFHLSCYMDLNRTTFFYVVQFTLYAVGMTYLIVYQIINVFLCEISPALV